MAAYTHEVPTERMNRFRDMLPAAILEAREAALLDPANPGPWVVMVTAARGAQYGHDRFRPLWEGLVARAPTTRGTGRRSGTGAPRGSAATGG
ncbi:hypothetical protein [Streptomyces sp. NBC_01216]|uniref:hypothetical protein n=1 Tax=unclassified Streptomyces TaxID=2593676 RepID=UPI002E1687C2|nr:hypothetical protein OG393_04145 [Streptomyces sp. NBC_01216]